VIVLKNRKVVYTHEQEFNGSGMIQNIERELSLKDWFTEGAQVRENLSDAQQQTINRFIQETLVPHLRQALQFFYSSPQNIPLAHLLLAGECATFPEVSKSITAEFGIPSTVANPFPGLATSNKIDTTQLNHIAPTLVISCGLALQAGDAQ